MGYFKYKFSSRRFLTGLILLIFALICVLIIAAYIALSGKGFEAVPVWEMSAETEQGAVRGKDMSASDIALLAEFVAAECEGEPLVCKIATAALILNRMESPYYPDCCIDVIFDPDSFCCIRNGTISENISAKERESCNLAVSIARNGRDPTSGACMLFHLRRDCCVEKPRSMSFTAGGMLFGNP